MRLKKKRTTSIKELSLHISQQSRERRSGVMGQTLHQKTRIFISFPGAVDRHL